jgi:hypothetical protein
MNIFYSSTCSNFYRDFLKGICEKIPSIGKIYTVKLNDQKKFEFKGKEVITINYDEYAFSNYNELEKALPIDLDIMNFLKKDLLIILKMMERLGDFRGSENFEKRLEMLHNHVKFWNSIIENQKIELGIFLSVPHEPFEYIIYKILKAKKKSTIIHQQLHFLDTYAIVENVQWNISNKKFFYKENKLENNKVLFKNAKETLLDLKSVEYKPFYHENIFKKSYKLTKYIRKIKSIISDIISIREFARYINYRTTKFFKASRTFKYFKQSLVDPDLNKKYIFIPLHFQPEVSTCPVGDIFVHQNLMISMLSYSLRNSDWIIYVKEHPNQDLSYGRTLEFYKEINSLDNVFLITNKITSKNILLKSKAVAIVTGTMGLEAISNEIPVLCFGEIYYKLFNGVFPIKTNNDLSSALKKIQNGYKPSFETLLNELKEIPSNYFHGYSNQEYEDESKISYSQNINNLVNNLNEYLLRCNLI